MYFGFGFTTPFGWLVYVLWFWFYYALWLASVFTLVLVLRQSSENRSNSFRISKLLMLITLLSAPSAVEWRASQSVVFGARPLTLFDLPVKNGKSGGSSSLSCAVYLVCNNKFISRIQCMASLTN